MFWIPLILAAMTTSPTLEKVFPYPVHTQKLPNGLTVITVPTEHRGLVAYYTVVRTGARNEVEKGKSGFAHFFEHMMFHGTKKFPPDEYNLILKEMGADSNAFTTTDWTCYHIVAPVSQLEKLYEIESDRFQNLTYEKPEFQKEARAVLGEYNKSASSPWMILGEKLVEKAYTTHTYQHTTIGFLEDIKDMPNQFEYSRIFFDRWYRPENCFLILVGDVTPRKTVKLAEKYYGDWKPGMAEDIVIPVEPPQTEEKKAEISWPTTTLPHIYMGYHVGGFDPADADWVGLDVLAQLLFSSSAPLYQDLVLERQLVDILQGGAWDQRDPALFRISARVKEEDRIGEVMHSIEAALEELAEKGPDPGRFAEVQSHMRYKFIRGLDSPDNIAWTVGHYVQLTGRVGAIEEFYRTLANLSPEDIQALARKFFRRENRTVVTLKGPNRS